MHLCQMSAWILLIGRVQRRSIFLTLPEVIWLNILKDLTGLKRNLKEWLEDRMINRRNLEGSRSIFIFSSGKLAMLLMISTRTYSKKNKSWLWECIITTLTFSCRKMLQEIGYGWTNLQAFLMSRRIPIWLNTQFLPLPVQIMP